MKKEQFVFLSDLDDMVFGEWDISDDLYASASHDGVLEKNTLDLIYFQFCIIQSYNLISNNFILLGLGCIFLQFLVFYAKIYSNVQSISIELVISVELYGCV